MNRLGNRSILDYVPDPNYPLFADHYNRNVFFRSTRGTSLGAVTVGTTDTFIASEPMRIRSAQVSTVTGGTITVQVKADGVPLYLDAYRPVSGSTSSEPSDIFIVPAGTVITTEIEDDSGAPSGTATVSLETEPFVLRPRQEQINLKGKDRLRPSIRREAELSNAGVGLVRYNLVGAAERQSKVGAAQLDSQTGGTSTNPIISGRGSDRRDGGPNDAGPGGGLHSGGGPRDR